MDLVLIDGSGMGEYALEDGFCAVQTPHAERLDSHFSWPYFSVFFNTEFTQDTKASLIPLNENFLRE